MNCALFWSGGKDSLLALDRATQMGLNVSHLVNIYEGNGNRVRFHGVRHSAITQQAAALGKNLVQHETHAEDFEHVFLEALEALKKLDIKGICFGNIHLADIRAWYESRTRSFGFEHIEPLWGNKPDALLHEFVERGHCSRIVSVNLNCGRPEWLGQTFTSAFVQGLLDDDSIDACGERGEYHSFAYGGPLFRTKLKMNPLKTFEHESHLILDFDLDADVD